MARNRHNIDKVVHFSKGVDVKPLAAVINPKELIKLRTTSVAWGIPCDEISFSRFWTRYNMYNNRMPWDDFMFSVGTYITKARNEIHNSYLDKSQSPYLAMLDSDILFPEHYVERLLAHKLPIVGGWYRDKNDAKHRPVVYKYTHTDENGIHYWDKRDNPGSGVEKVDGTGAGCWLMSREVAEALGKNPYDMNSGGEDLVLSKKMMDLGIPLHVDWSINCAHMGVGFY